jgi:hypothetical protein
MPAVARKKQCAKPPSLHLQLLLLLPPPALPPLLLLLLLLPTLTCTFQLLCTSCGFRRPAGAGDGQVQRSGTLRDYRVDFFPLKMKQFLVP